MGEEKGIGETALSDGENAHGESAGTTEEMPKPKVSLTKMMKKPKVLSPRHPLIPPENKRGENSSQDRSDSESVKVFTDKEKNDLNEDFKAILSQNGGDHSKALFEFCYKHDVFYSNTVADPMTLTDDEDQKDKLPFSYIDVINGDQKYNGLTFFRQIKQKNFEQLYSHDLATLDLDEETQKNRLAVIDILAYDPFFDDDAADKPQLYRDMTGMLSENMRKDVAKAKAALSIVRGYNNLEKYQRKITEIMRTASIDEETQKQIDQYIKVQKTLQDSINATAEKNNFTAKGIGVNGRGMLSDVMRQISDNGIDEGVTNFYDIETSKSIEEVANISFKAQMNQINLSKTDYADILNGQCRLVREAQAMAKKAIEAERLAKEKITKQKLLEELAREYRKKKISEREIQAFIDREYHLYDGEKSGE